MKLSDYVVQFLVDKGIRNMFLVSGGGIMHMLDSVGRNPEITYYCNSHEQACAVSAEGHARVTGKPGVCLATVGPGSSNALSGILSAWTDSIPLIVLVGQVRQDLIADYTKLRQFGPQEANTIDMARPVTKYAVSIRDPKRVRYEMERAWHEATSGRPGPVWVEFPLDVQGANVDESELIGFDIPPPPDSAKVAGQVRDVIAALRAAKRPIFIAGNGIRLAGALGSLHAILDRSHIPVVMPFAAKDLVADASPHNLGVFGTAGQRRANFAVQNSDCVISLGAGLNCQKVGFNFKGFAPNAKKIIVEIDEHQLFDQAIKPDVAVHCDVGLFLAEFLRQTEHDSLRPADRWLQACANWKQRYPLITSDYFDNPECVNSYVFMDKLSDALKPEDTIVAGAGLDVVSWYQAFRSKSGQRSFSSAWGSMGWDLPMTIGACVGARKRRTICVTGDGSIQWNIQELLTISRYRLPIKIFIFNNLGYASIRATQNSFFEGRYVGADHASGLANPDFMKIAEAYGLGYSRIANNAALGAGLAAALADDQPAICEVNLAKDQGISPKASAFRRPDGTFESRPLEDMSPFLPREEVHENMHLFDEEGA